MKKLQNVGSMVNISTYYGNNTGSYKWYVLKDTLIYTFGWTRETKNNEKALYYHKLRKNNNINSIFKDVSRIPWLFRLTILEEYTL